MVNLLPRISPNRINEVLESIDGYKFITSSLKELDLSKKLELSRKRIYVVHTDSDEIIHITLSIDADNIYKNTKLFYIEYPEISCKPLFFRKTNSFALLGQEYFDGKPIDYCFDNGILNEDNVVKILKHINMVFDAKLKS